MDYEELAQRMVARLKEKSARKSVEMSFVNKEAAITNSKLGGVPFLPEGGSYPVDRKTGEKLYLLVQINFAEMPSLLDYPEEGILQIYIASDDLYGLDFDDMKSQEQWRIIYHEDISKPMAREQIVELMPDLTNEDYMLPMERLNKEYAIEFEEADMPISLGDTSFAKVVAETCSDLLPKDLQGVDWYDYPDEMIEVLEESLGGSGSRLGGYPDFTQEDPRGYGIPENCQLFLQIDSDGDENGEWAIMWGDAGIGNFFIAPEDLKKKDFTRVYYNWDCC